MAVRVESFLYPIESAYWVGCFCWSSNVSIDPDDSMLVCILHNKIWSLVYNISVSVYTSMRVQVMQRWFCLFVYNTSFIDYVFKGFLVWLFWNREFIFVAFSKIFVNRLN